jgi:hypothetical protein
MRSFKEAFSAGPRISKSGKPYVVTTVKLKNDDAFQFVRATAFSESVQAELLRLQDGDAVAVQGPLKAELYTAADGMNKIALSMIADCVLALRQPPKKREPKTKPASSAQEPERALDDSIPF